MRFVGRGHPAVRATHPKTLELSPGDGLTERGTCIVAVGTEAQPPHPMAGPVRLRISAGGLHANVSATANPSWDPAGPAVVRRGPLRLPGTFATDADTAAADLPRELVTALQDPDSLVTVDVVAVPVDGDVVVLFAADPSRPDDPRLAAELAAADTVEPQDAAARTLVTARRGDGRRRLVVATADLPRPGATTKDATVDVLGLPPALAVAAACVADGPLVVLTGADDPREALRRQPAGVRIATSTTPTELAGLLEYAALVRGSSACVTAQQHGPPTRADADRLPTLYGRDAVFVCFEAVAGQDALDPAVRAAIEGLLADGVPTRGAADALATLTGRSRRAAYDTVLAWRADLRAPPLERH